jgi:imidazolonepropionase-like amidohydrolase
VHRFLPSTRSSLAALALLIAAAGPAAAQDATVVALRVGHLLPGGDVPPLENATIIIREGRIVALGHELELPPGVELVERPEAWAVAGFIDVSVGLGARFDRDELAAPLAPDVTTAWITDPDHPDFAAARGAGITTCLLTPGDGNLFGGWSTLVKTTGDRIAGAAPVAKLSLGPQVLRGDRPPTSRSGALDLLRRRLRQAHNAQPGDRDLIRPFAHGETAGLWSAGSGNDLRVVLELTRSLGLNTIVRLDPSIGVADLDGLDLTGVAVVVGPYDLDSPARCLRVPAALVAAGATPIFTSQAPDRGPAEGLRLTAALAVRHGLSASDALAAMTAHPARALGLELGTLDTGSEADLVLLDGPPTDLTSQVLETWVGGRRVHGRPAHPAQERP